MGKENSYVNFDNSVFVETRKGILNSMIGTIKLLKKQENYKSLKDEEKNLKQAFQKEMKDASSKINEFIISLPSAKEFEKPEEKIRRTKTRTAKESSENFTEYDYEKRKTKSKLDSELQDIRNKLASL
ncbi:MAG: hypothetical protein KJ767_03015 [Nanoarchaeota archaeon]|nr:hypothetical protein [Nanoarchaeota archaeon]